VAQSKSIWGKVVFAGFILSVLLGAGFEIEHFYKVDWVPSTIRTWSLQDEKLWARHQTNQDPDTVTWSGGPVVLRVPEKKGMRGAACTFWPTTDLAQRDWSKTQSVTLTENTRLNAYVWQGTPNVPAPSSVMCVQSSSEQFLLVSMFTGSQVAGYDSATSLGGWWLRVLITAAPFAVTLVLGVVFGTRKTNPASSPPAPVGQSGPPPPPQP
jgi:hypothetical protein